MLYRLKRIFRIICYYILDDVYLESILLDLLIFFGFIFGRIGYIIASLIFIVFAIVKISKRGLKKSIFTLNLIEQQEENAKFMVYGLLNILLFLLIIQLNTAKFHTFVAICVLRLVMAYENINVQYYIVTDTIEDLYSEGEVKTISKLSDKKTIECLKFIELIKEDIKGAADKKVESERLKTELITNISHDLKTPLTSIINYTDILSKKDSMDSEAKKYIEILGRNSERLMSLITDLIYASKTGSGNVKVEKVFIDFNELVSQIYGDFNASFTKRNLEFIYTADNEEIKLYTDGNILSRIIQNLVSNTYKYSKEGTRIYAQTETTDEKLFFKITNTSATKLDMEEYTVSELVEELFKTEKARTTEGSGLGLYITKNLVEILGGKFEIEVKDYQFTVFLELDRD